MLWGINLPFGRLSPSMRQVTHVLLTRPPLSYPRRNNFARLACVKHAASVRPEPGSNSQFKSLAFINYIIIDKTCSLLFL